MSFRPAGLLAVAIALLSACGSTSTRSTSPPPARPPATLAASAVPYLPSTVKSLTPALLTREAQAPGMATSLQTWRFQSGADRYFQGESHRLQIVDSRTLRFGEAAGAASFVAFMRSHLAAYLGSLPRLHGLAEGGRHGFLAVGQECQCHLANPTYLAVVAQGKTVSWLEINGPGATRPGLMTLLHRAP